MVNEEPQPDIWIPTPAELAEVDKPEVGSVRRQDRTGRDPRRRRMSLSTRVTGHLAGEDQADG